MSADKHLEVPKQQSETSSDGKAFERPSSLTNLFWAFTTLALQGFGGVLAIVQRDLVEKKRWLSRDQFLEDWAVAQVLPGPNVVNLSLMIGDRYFGWRGALVALAGMLVFPVLIVLAAAVLLAGYSDSPQVQGALRGMSAVAAGLIAATGLKLVASLRKNVLSPHIQYAFIAIVFVLIVVLHVRLAWVLLGVGGSSAWLAYHRLGRSESLKGTP